MTDTRINELRECYLSYRATKQVLSLNDYADKASTFAVYPDASTGKKGELMYLALGLSNESGEVAGKVKKLYRDGELDIESFRAELGDVMWYWSNLCHCLGMNPTSILNENIAKLQDRMLRGVIKGSGDKR